MALSGIQIYKLLPQTNCRDCNFPTCLAFAMKLAAKQVDPADCPHLSDEAKATLSESAAPPIRLVAIKAGDREVKAGGEVVMFRHEKTFYNLPGIFVRVTDDQPLDAIREKAAAAASYHADYVGIDLTLDGIAVQAKAGGAEAFAAAVSAVREVTNAPLILMGTDPEAMGAALMAVDGEKPLIAGANASNWEAMAALAKQHSTPLAVSGTTLDQLADLSEKVKGAGVEDIVLDPSARDMSGWLTLSTQIRRLALKNNFRPLGYPVLAVPGDAADPARESMMAAQAIAKYAGFVVLDTFTPGLVYPLLVLRQNIYTDPQKPIQVLPGLYEINNPQPGDPVLVTTNFSITYFSVANEVEGSGKSAWLLVADAEGMSVLTAWAAGKFDAERIAKAVKTFGLEDKVTNKRIVLPGSVAVLSGELEDELPGWAINVGPREAVDINSYMENVLKNN